jgi:hypothetical protein
MMDEPHRPSPPPPPPRNGCLSALIIVGGIVLLLPGLYVVITAYINLPSLVIEVPKTNDLRVAAGKRVLGDHGRVGRLLADLPVNQLCRDTADPARILVT